MSADEPVGLTRCPSSRSRQLRGPWGIASCQSLKSAFIAIQCCVGPAGFAWDVAEGRVDQGAQPSPHHVHSIPAKVVYCFCSKALGQPRVL